MGHHKECQASIKTKKIFLQAIRLTSSISGFSDILTEKDYYASLILNKLFQSYDCPLVFKGVTLLNKTHVGFLEAGSKAVFPKKNL